MSLAKETYHLVQNGGPSEEIYFNTFFLLKGLRIKYQDNFSKALFSGQYQQKVRYAMSCEEILGVCMNFSVCF